MREDEFGNLDEMVSFGCMLPIKGGGLASVPGKVNCLLQVTVSERKVMVMEHGFSRISREPESLLSR